MSNPVHLVAVNVGNTRTRLGDIHEAGIANAASFGSDDVAAIVGQVAKWWSEAKEPRAIVMASVNDPAADRLAATLTDQLGAPVYRIGEDVPIPIDVRLDPETITGVDRLLNAVAAFETLEQACVVIDAGTAIVVVHVEGNRVVVAKADDAPAETNPVNDESERP